MGQIADCFMNLSVKWIISIMKNKELQELDKCFKVFLCSAIVSVIFLAGGGIIANWSIKYSLICFIVAALSLVVTFIANVQKNECDERIRIKLEMQLSQNYKQAKRKLNSRF